MEKIFNECVNKVSQIWGIALTYLNLKVSPHAEDVDGNPRPNYDNRFAGCLVRNKGYVILNSDLSKAMEYYGVSSDKDTFLRYIIFHELGHELYHKDFPIIKRLINRVPSDFMTSYLEKERNSDEERFCEYFAYLTMNFLNDVEYSKLSDRDFLMMCFIFMYDEYFYDADVAWGENGFRVLLEESELLDPNILITVSVAQEKFNLSIIRSDEELLTYVRKLEGKDTVRSVMNNKVFPILDGVLEVI